MSIESSPPAGNPKLLGAIENGAGIGNGKNKGKLKPDDDAPGLAGGGFPGLMTALKPAAELGTALPVPGADAQSGALSAAGLPNDLALLLAQAGVGLTNGGVRAPKTTPEPASRLDAALSMASVAPGADQQPGLVLPGLTPDPAPSEVRTGLAPDSVALSAAVMPNELALSLTQAGAGLGNGAVLAHKSALAPAAELGTALRTQLSTKSSTALVAPGAISQPGLVAPALMSEPREVRTGLAAELVVPDVPVSDAPLESPVLVSSADAAKSPAPLPVDAAQILPGADALAPGVVALGLIPLAVPTTVSADPAPSTRVAARASSVAADKGQGDPTLAVGLAPLSGNPEEAKHSVGERLEQAIQSAPASPGKATSGGFKSGLAMAMSDPPGFPSAGRPDLAAREPALPALLVGGEAADTLLKPTQRLANRFPGLAGSAGVEGAWGHQALFGGSRVSASAALVSTPTQSLESMVADTVSYWTTQGVQNAELKLDGFGDEAVAVRISLKGDQAHIGFRTDQPEIRQMLEGALAQLKEVLKSDGLVLSGVSVGSSGHNGAGAQEQRERADSRQSRQASLITPQAGPLPGRQRLDSTVGRALDMFV